jgi:hypothetical protein
MDGFSVGDVVQGFGLHNAGRFATVKKLSNTRGRALLEMHLDGRQVWVWLKFWRLAE